MSDSIIISDLSQAEPESALARKPKKNCWYAMDYKLKNGTEGVMLSASPDYGAREICIPLNVNGTYKIFIGINRPRQPYGKDLEYFYGSLRLKLTGDRGYSRLGWENYDHRSQGKFPSKKKPKKGSKFWERYDDRQKKCSKYNVIYEIYWKTAELTYQSLLIDMPGMPYSSEYYRELANISLIRLEPVSDEDIKFEKEIKPRPETKNLIAFWCGGALSGHTAGHRMYHPTEREWFEEEMQPFRNSDFNIINFEGIRGNVCLFKTEHGEVGTWDKTWKDEWLDPLTEFTRLAHESGIKLFISMRMIGAGGHNAFSPINWGRNFWNNQQWAKVTKEGRKCPNFSLAYKGAREYWLTLLKEALDYGIDGINVLLGKSQPFVLYEEPSIEDFKEKYGVDPRTLSRNDDRWKKHVADYVTQFLREIRELLDEKPGRELSVRFKLKNGSFPYDGCDPEVWLKEDLVDHLCLATSVPPAYMKKFKELNENTKVYYGLKPRQMPGTEYIKLAQELYDKGADGFSVWDCVRRTNRKSEWNVLKHLGHRDMLEELKERAPDYFRFNVIEEIRGIDVEYAHKSG